MYIYMTDKSITDSQNHHDQDEHGGRVKQNEETPEIRRWDELDLPANILRGIYAYGFENPSPIQCKAISPIIQGRDVVAQAQSGTGKTAAFTIGMLTRISLDENSPQAIIIVPTRELVFQIASVVSAIGGTMDKLAVKTLVGGCPVDEDVRKLQRTPPHVIVSSPGRLYDMINRRAFSTENIKILIVDEADEMLSDGFVEQLHSIVDRLPTTMQIVFFSATFPRSVNYTIDQITRDPKHIVVKTEALTLEGIGQYYVAIDSDEQKYMVLKDLYSSLSLSHCIIYCNSIERVSMLSQAMTDDGFPVCCIHSNMSKTDREKSMSDFRNGKFRVLISSNVTARGIDIQQVSVVINFDVCKSVHTYLHRIGRSGRWGRKGIGINFVTSNDVNKLRNIERHYATQIEELPNNFMNIIK